MTATAKELVLKLYPKATIVGAEGQYYVRHGINGGLSEQTFCKECRSETTKPTSTFFIGHGTSEEEAWRNAWFAVGDTSIVPIQTM